MKKNFSGSLLCIVLIGLMAFSVSGCGDKTKVSEPITSNVVDCQSCAQHVSIIQGLQDRIGSLQRDNNTWKTKAQKAELDLMAAEDQLAVMASNQNTMNNPSEFLDALDRIDRRISKLPTASGDVSVSALPDNSGYKITIVGDLLFNSGKADIRKEGKQVLTSLMDTLKTSKGNIRIDGHTDNVKVAKAETRARFPKGNWQLGSERALNVLLFLKQKGVSESRLSYLSWGQFQPRADNKTPEGRRQNRRVEIMVLFESN